MHQFYMLLKIIFIEMYQYASSDKIIVQKYANILKTYFDNDILTKMLCVFEMIEERHQNNNHNLYFNIKNIIEEHSLFQYLDLNLTIPDNRQTALNKQRILRFRIPAFEGNMDILPIRIALEKNPNELKKYCIEHYTQSEKEVRQAIAQNPNTPWEILERLSQDNEKEVAQAARDNLKKQENA